MGANGAGKRWPTLAGRIAKTILALGVTTFCLFAALRGIEFSAFWTAVTRADVGLIAASIVVALLSLNVRALRWQRMLAPVKRVSHWSAYDAYVIGMAVNNILPARAGEFARAHLVGRREGFSRVVAFSSIVAERLLDLCALLGVGAAAVTWYPFPDETRAKVRLGLGLALGLLALVALMVVGRRRLRPIGTRLLQWVPERMRDRLESVLRSLIEGMRFVSDPRRAAEAILLTAVTWGIVVLSVWISLQAMHVEVPPMVSGLVLAATGVGMMVPAAPGGIGTFEFAVVFALVQVGVERSDAAAYAVVLHVSQLVPVCVIGALCAWYFHWARGASISPTGDSETELE